MLPLSLDQIQRRETMDRTLLDGQEQELSNLLCFKDKDERIVVMIGLLVTMFFENQLRREVREAVADVAEDYIRLTRDHLLWVVPNKAKREVRVNWERVKLPREWLPEYPDGETWSFQFSGGLTARAASAFHIDSFGSSPGHDGGLGFLHASFPLLWFTEDRGTFPDYVLKLCKRVRPLSGYAGLGVLESPEGYTRREFHSIVREIALRFPGLEVEDRVGHTIHLRGGIKGVNWLTILGERWIKEVGGLDYLRTSLREPFGFYPYDGGLLIQAGPKPQLGDVQANRWPQHYVALAKVLKKIQVKAHPGFHWGRPNGMTTEETMAWLCRFDGK
jgi:hypothetical protein